MIEIENNRLYWNGLFTCYAAHTIPDPIDGNVTVLYSHSLGRTLLCVDGKYWMGDRDGSMPEPHIIVGQVVSTCGLLRDPETLNHLIELVQVREDDGLSVRIRVS